MRKEPRKRCDHCGKFSRESSMDLYTLPENVLKHDYYGVAICAICSEKYTDDYWLSWLKSKGWDTPHRPTKDDTDLVAAALGLESSTWAKAVVHITEPEFNAAINGEQVLKNGKRVKKG